MDLRTVAELARKYSDQVQRATSLAIAAEPEAQLTVPVANFFSAFAAEVGLGDLGLIREAQLDGVRPDFAATINQRQCGWVELKAPGHVLIGEKWRGREKGQWELLSQLDSLIVTNGEAAMLYVNGVVVAESELPFESPESWEPDPFKDLLQKFILVKATSVKRVSQLADRLAPLARFLRNRLDDGLENNFAPVIQAKEAWDATVHETTSAGQFSSDVAQVVAYSMAIAGMTGQADLNADGIITLREAKDTLALGHRNVLAAALGPIIGIPELTEYIAPELGAITRLISSMDVQSIQSANDSRGEPWLWFYEDFLAKYDPEARKQAGVYYTPTSVVQCQVRIVDDVLRHRFGQSLGFGSKSVVTLDPATGSGTYPIAVIDQAVETAYAERGPAGTQQVARNLTKNLLAFEILPGPYAVAHLRIGQRLAEAKSQLVQFDDIGVYLTDTLEDPATQTRPGLFGDAKVLAEAADEARRIKAEQRITVAIGNPPYDRVTSDSGGWVTAGNDFSEPLFDDVIKPAQESGVIFSAQASLYNLYVYFWRWAIWKTFQQPSEEKAVISFITASSWLDGPAFVGLRKLAVDTANDIWILDLGGEGRGARKEDNVFAIQSPVAIVTLVKSGKATRAAKIYYRRIRGTRQEKLLQLDRVKRLHAADGWTEIASPNGEKFIPDSTNKQWERFPLLADLFPWQQPGMMYNRMWPVAPSPQVLKKRWRYLLEDIDAGVRTERYVAGKSGRNIYTKVGSLDPLVKLSADAEHQPIVRMGWRSFDQQWAFDDPRLANLERPALWQSLSDKQIFLVSPWTVRISHGPAATVSVGVPDKHYFRGSFGGKDVIPLYRDKGGERPNIADGLREKLGAILGVEVSPEDFFAYCYALIAHSGYSSMFHEPLESSPVRVPITRSPELFVRAVEMGEELLWLQTFGQRFVSDTRPHGRVPRIDGLFWLEPVDALPEDVKEISYNAETRQLHIGDGIICGVAPEVWEFEVSGMSVLGKWLGARTRKGIGRAAGKAATPLDLIRPTEWEDEWNDELLDLLRILTSTVELGAKQMRLLEEVVQGELVEVEELPAPADSERKVPKTVKRDYGQTSLIF
ncbi:type ISP restriction/modification enzyme [Corynebacterium haemomassiliense]|uniref:type ISP restriction/modification enzyme n=1 Tax=Corynebacterium haemomassiliense TaxID=2754726 RepID=UPI00288C3DD1|nr:type ISP restriction/modification enzyme [Corynebacterium haemomassiliense]